MMRPAALIVAAGQGLRAGADIPKQFLPLNGEALVSHAVDALAGMPVHLVVGAGQRALLNAALAGRTVASVTEGGAERQESVARGLRVVAESDATHVLIHDAARPLVPTDVVARLLAALEEADAAVPVLPVVDTLARGDGALGPVVDRDGLVRVQTPQAFRLDTIMAAHASWQGGPATDDAQLVRAMGVHVATVTGDAQLEKITLPGDIERLARALPRISRTGLGFDVHRLEPGEELWLCGVKVPHERGLSGHSDADVGLHALVDALLGTIAAGDIGAHFPPSDPKWRGARSRQFVEHARSLVTAAGGRVEHVDVTLICEAPKIGPHRAAMQAAIAEILGLPISVVSVKATTTERLGLTGRGEGIAAQAVATVSFGQQV